MNHIFKISTNKFFRRKLVFFVRVLTEKLINYGHGIHWFQNNKSMKASASIFEHRKFFMPVFQTSALVFDNNEDCDDIISTRFWINYNDVYLIRTLYVNPNGTNDIITLYDLALGYVEKSFGYWDQWQKLLIVSSFRKTLWENLTAYKIWFIWIRIRRCVYCACNQQILQELFTNNWNNAHYDGCCTGTMPTMMVVVQ